ncbi:MAG: sulfatase-like hydrolase/transferase [Candidatus Latescibacterota bacterium]|nr:sulfatase-like hydrolase/transferase [Candidatus Latescibacterota bacterium]
MTDRPHVLVLMCDQMQAQRLGCLDPVVHTPFLDGLVGEGIHLTHLISSHGQCVPSRASFITGLYPHECGVVVNYGFHGHQNRLSPTKYRALGHVFSDAGYRTAYFGKCHFGVPLTELGYQEGIDHDGHKVDDNEAARRGVTHVPNVLRRDYVGVSDALEYLRSYKDDGRPLFLTFSTNLPHPPFFHEIAHQHRFDAASLELPVSFYEESFSGKPPFQEEHACDGSHGAWDEDAAREELAQYLSMIAITDEHCGRVAAEFKRLGLWDNTVVLFVADHGDMMGAHHTRLKGTLPYDELYRVPGILKLPVSLDSPRSKIDDLVSSVQLAGTLARLAGVGGDEFPHGDLLAALQAPGHPEDEMVFFEHHAAYWGTHPFRGARTREWKYVEYFGDDACEELYHLAEDPHELHNLAGVAEYRSVQQELTRRMRDWWQNTDGRDFAYYESDAFRKNQHNQ